jgi:hypothetical protein
MWDAQMDAGDEMTEERLKSFESAPFGVWTTGPSAHTPQSISFYQDYSGVCKVHAPSGVQSIHFEWREHAHGSLRIREIVGEEDNGSDIAEGDPDWMGFTFELEMRETPRGPEVAMRLIRFGQLSNMPDPLYYRGPEGSAADAAIDHTPARSPSADVHEPIHGLFVPAVFVTGLIIGVILIVLSEMNVPLDPEVVIPGSIILFFLVCLVIGLVTRKRPSIDAHGEPQRE